MRSTVPIVFCKKNTMTHNTTMTHAIHDTWQLSLCNSAIAQTNTWHLPNTPHILVHYTPCRRWHVLSVDFQQLLLQRSWVSHLLHVLHLFPKHQVFFFLKKKTKVSVINEWHVQVRTCVRVFVWAHVCSMRVTCVWWHRRHPHRQVVTCHASHLVFLRSVPCVLQNSSKQQKIKQQKTRTKVASYDRTTGVAARCGCVSCHLIQFVNCVHCEDVRACACVCVRARL